jgi:Flp pilus assembly protein TadG
MVEFALTLVVILLLLAGVVDLGRAIFTYLSLRDAAQEGASFASYNPVDTAGIQTRACDSSNLVLGLCNAGLVTVTPSTVGASCNGSSISVEVFYPGFQLVTPFLGAIIGSQTIPIRASITDTILVPPCS